MSTFDIKKFLIKEGMTRVSRDRERLLKEQSFEDVEEYGLWVKVQGGRALVSEENPLEDPNAEWFESDEEQDGVEQKNIPDGLYFTVDSDVMLDMPAKFRDRIEYTTSGNGRELYWIPAGNRENKNKQKNQEYRYPEGRAGKDFDFFMEYLGDILKNDGVHFRQPFEVYCIDTEDSDPEYNPKVYLLGGKTEDSPLIDAIIVPEYGRKSILASSCTSEELHRFENILHELDHRGTLSAGYVSLDWDGIKRSVQDDYRQSVEDGENLDENLWKN